MGTRGLTCVVKDGKFRVAQYGQWDHYLGGQGKLILHFLREADISKFSKKVENCFFGTREQIVAAYDSLNQKREFEKPEFWYLSLDTGGKILDVVMQSEKPLMLEDESEFAGDSLFCEYAYVVDLDKKTFQVYKGFKKTPAPENERFAVFNDKKPNFGEKRFYPVQLLKEYHLDNLPTDEEFCDERKKRRKSKQN